MFPGNPERQMLSSIVELLIKQTKSGKVRWQSSDAPGTYLTTVGANSVTVSGVKDTLTLGVRHLFPEITVRDASGATRVTAGGVGSMVGGLSLAPTGMDELAKLIAEQASGVDPILHELAQELKDLE